MALRIYIAEKYPEAVLTQTPLISGKMSTIF